MTTPINGINDLQVASKAISKEIYSLQPSDLITLFEIDLSSLASSKNIVDQNYQTVFRFHNHIKETNGGSLYWSGNDGIEKQFIAAPIQAVGFEYNSKGTLPTPKLSITANEKGIIYLDILKQRMIEYGDLVGAKVTRIRTFSKFLDAKNFLNGNVNADWTREFPRDVFYIDRKSAENKFTIEFELASVLDVEGLILPQRLVLSKCFHQYRGSGCFYECAANRTSIHGNGSLPEIAPPVATYMDESIKKILGDNTQLNLVGKWVSGQNYNKGDCAFIEKNDIKYYYVSKMDANNNSITDSRYWIQDSCSKSLAGCKLRWGSYSWATGPIRGSLPAGVLPFGGFPSVSRYGLNLF